jgi:ubiquinone/menaquinone biosynthesis C-methylase UbiE
MENDEESLRLDIKTDINIVKEQATWGGLKPGMKVLDIGCGIGKTTRALYDIVQPHGTATGIDFSRKRINHAESLGSEQGLHFYCRDFTDSIEDLGKFDFIWIRFVLEYFKGKARLIIENVAKTLTSGGILCLIDLDHNAMNHFEMPPRLEKALAELVSVLEKETDFDPYIGRKLYSHLYDLGFQDISVKVGAHHVIYGELNSRDSFNWSKKLQVLGERLDIQLNEYGGGFSEFAKEFQDFFSNKRRFSYTPIIQVRGRKP